MSFLSRQGQHQPHCHSKDRQLNTQLLNGLLSQAYLVHHEVFTGLVRPIDLDNLIRHIVCLFTGVDALSRSKSPREGGPLFLDSMSCHDVHVLSGFGIDA